MLRRAIHKLERSHWARETRRVTHPFAWGIEHLGGDPARDEPRSFLRRYAEEAVASSEKFFSTTAAEWYQFHEGVLTFPSALQSPFPENNLVVARWFPSAPASRDGMGRQRPSAPRRAVVVLPQWNAQPESHVNICRVLARLGISALRWLEQQGYTRLGILGTSIGSSVAFITMAHEPALQAGVFLHVSTYFADVVRTGLTTSHVWAGLESHVTAEELRQFWLPISPFPYVGRLQGAGKKLFIVSARYDLSFPPQYSRQLWEAMAEQRIAHQVLSLPCGHYTLGKLPFSYWAGLRFVPFLRRALAGS